MKMTKAEQQKIFDSAFGVVIVLTLFTLIFRASFGLGVFDVVFIIIFVVLGFLTKKGYKYAPLLLLALFCINIISRIIVIATLIISAYPDTAKAQGLLYQTIIPALITIYLFKKLLLAYSATKATLTDAQSDKEGVKDAATQKLEKSKNNKIVKWILILTMGYIILYFLGDLSYRLMFPK